MTTISWFMPRTSKERAKAWENHPERIGYAPSFEFDVHEGRAGMSISLLGHRKGCLTVALTLEDIDDLIENLRKAKKYSEEHLVTDNDK